MSQPSDTVRLILSSCRSIAVVGLSPQPYRPSHSVSRAMQAQGYRIIPVNPNADAILGEKAYRSLTEAAQYERIELVNIFRNAEEVPPLIDEAIAIGARAVWMQLGIAHAAAARKAEAAGLLVVQDACIAVEHARLALR